MDRASSPVALAAGPVLCAAAWLASRWAGLSPEAAWTAAVTALCAAWWITEAIPIPATSLIPFAVFPFVGVLDHAKVARSYGDTIILLLLGGFILSMAMERSGAHRRLALGMVKAVGGHGGRRLVLGFMIACAVISMWISNTAATLMFLPVALATLEHDRDKRLGKPLMLGLAYSANIGGLGTPVGTPPNLIFMGMYKTVTGTDFSFLDWMKFGVPLVAVLVPATWWWLLRGHRDSAPLVLPPVGPFRSAEARVLAVFALTAVAWTTRTEPWGGWSRWFGVPGASDSTVALAAVVLLFLVPDGEGKKLLDWQTANKIPWGLLLLFGGGLALAEAFESTGLSGVIAQGLSGIAAWPRPLLVFGIVVAVVPLTEIASNTATATLLMPLLAATAKAAGVEPALFMVPGVLAASTGFMMPAGTAPNAIVLGSGHLTTAQMVRAGFAIDVVCIVAITAVCLVILG